MCATWCVKQNLTPHLLLQMNQMPSCIGGPVFSTGPAYKYCTMAWTHCSLANAWPIKTINSKVMNWWRWKVYWQLYRRSTQRSRSLSEAWPLFEVQHLLVQKWLGALASIESRTSIKGFAVMRIQWISAKTTPKSDNSPLRITVLQATSTWKQAVQLTSGPLGFHALIALNASVTSTSTSTALPTNYYWIATFAKVEAMQSCWSVCQSVDRKKVCMHWHQTVYQS